LSGNGLFVVKQGSQVYYTRDGAFEFDAQGNYVLPGSGHFVQGWMATEGVLPESKTDANMDKITISADSTINPKATTSAKYSGNIDAGLANGTELTTTLPVNDSEGFSYSVPIIFKKTANNTWAISSTSTDPAVSVSGTLVFDENGKVSSGGSSTITITITSGAADPVTVTAEMGDVTQFQSESGSTIHVAETDGYGMGTLESVSIDSSGVITGVYTNGLRRTEAQVAIAQFNNASGLTKTGSSFYQESNNSGKANVGTAASLGCSITPSALEMSNVDIANEFSDMIITQRGFQSNSKIITVGDEMLETLINMKR
jgi:flagellar hook protein FlgE